MCVELVERDVKAEGRRNREQAALYSPRKKGKGGVRFFGGQTEEAVEQHAAVS